MIKSASIPVIEKGEGKPLIFLHGFMCSKEYFSSQLNYFSHYFKVVAYDLYGFGESAPAEEVYDLSDYAEEFISLAKAYGEKVNVIAHSFGCRVVLKSTQIAPDLIDKAVLCGAAGLKPNFNLKKFWKSKIYKIARNFLPKERCEKLFFSQDYNMLDERMKQSFKLVTSEYLDGILPSVRSSVLAVFGENDDQTPKGIADKLTAKIPNSGKYIMKDCGHFCFAERPTEFNAVTKEFLI